MSDTAFDDTASKNFVYLILCCVHVLAKLPDTQSAHFQNFTLTQLSLNSIDFLGFVNLDDLLHIGLIKRHSREEVIAEVNKKAVSGKSRFELVCRDGRDMIRASFGRNFRPVSDTCYALCQFHCNQSLLTTSTYL